MSDETSRLVQEASNGIDFASEELLTRFLPELRAFVRLRAGAKILSHESEEDVVQSVCREVLQEISSFEYRGLASFKSWLYFRTLRKIYERNRHYSVQKRDVRREEPFPTDPQYLSGFCSLLTPSRVAIQSEDVERLVDAFDRLPEEYREVITMAKLIGLGHEEIGQRMGRSPGATRALLYRALARLGVLTENTSA